jgi:pimeloyl-ACP methyl ester carboxylesterase
MRLRAMIGWALVSAMLGAGSAASAATQPAPGAPGARTAPKVIKRSVTFQVKNVNGSALSCASDGAQYEVKGHLIEPASQAPPGESGPRSVTLYLHDGSVGESFWSFTAVPGYDYAAAMARAGHASVMVDRLGYGSSGQPAGNATCLGSEADVTHQMIGKLRSGDYVVEGGSPPRFERVALAGHGAGGLIANIEAISFKDTDGLVVMSYAPQVTMRAFQQFYRTREVCLEGGEPAKPGGPGEYAYFGQTEADFRANLFHSAKPTVREAATRLRVRDPCGATASLVDGLVRDLMSLSEVKVPVLIVCGREDSMTPPFVCPNLKRRYVGSSDATLSFVASAGKALPLERTAPTFRRRVATWLGAHGF